MLCANIITEDFLSHLAGGYYICIAEMILESNVITLPETRHCRSYIRLTRRIMMVFL
jgi:hypothetical protein